MRTKHLDLTIVNWRKSTHSGNGGGCVVIAEQYPGIMPIGDSKDLSRTPVVVTRGAFASFVSAVTGPDTLMRKIRKRS
ncbi:DUF397 domain-containing protein [Streptomyces sp. UNOC14_S4]|uniref:DUF397 domain-containing protein n=1 Tax=Streptomyces sp. UNOC14_S4 TaxID=2872340 RepID=UPI001E5A4227|nr:DUF397 domain-containing protein [Streptomyces sp. UNOC14_S4]MCC3770153.1 DUF397 domain-containing protein [Streptomyces sp. UNOC14_S4]